MEQTIEIMLVDDHAVLRAGLKLLLQKRPTYKVIGEAADGLEALELYDKLMPHILILDISLPRLDGVQVLQRIKAKHKEAKIIVLTMHEDEDFVNSIMQSGASGFIPKVAVDEDLYAAIDHVVMGNLFLRPKETQALLSSMLKKNVQQAETQVSYEQLSPREREVLTFLARGYSLVEIAQQLTLSIKTVDTHKTRLMNKLNVTKKSELVEFAMKHRLLDEG
ncbi:response regulator transcription factor [Paenibacillus sp. GSMTC-2017]|uniref:response regulator n=1 Tax=Paenibacillus sp. GSMTC-2017 TaxID=2794350 RepID=UPI0018D6ED48|nr:response regulator transcription factor [Paenibacillus sp. GSMTC-2017]MBH5318845.1 response regulator transcription factor [Paenibacillus sp. GSMTC-2017]